MQLILAIDSDPRRSEQLAALVRTARLTVDLVQATSAGEGLHALRDRVPDLILTSPLLSPFDDGVLDEYLRDLGAAATHVQTVRIPVLSAVQKKKSSAKSLFGLGRKKKTPTSSAAPDGCDPKVFADEIAHYLTRSLEERTASAKASAEKSARQTTAPVDHDPIVHWFEEAAAADSAAAADPLVEEFAEPIYDEPPPIAAAPEPAFVQTYVVEESQPAPVVIEDRHVPGSILDLRPPIVRAPEPAVIVKPAAPIVRPEPPIVRPEPPIVEPGSPIFEPEPVIVTPEPAAIVAPEPPVIVTPAAASEPAVVNMPPTPATASGTSASFEAALAAIRAAWVKPEDKKDGPTPPNGAVPGRPKPLGAASGEVDLTNQIDALEDVAGIDGQTPGADNEPSPESKTPVVRESDKAKKRPEKSRGRKTRGADGRDEWGVFDPNQCGFAALVNKLDEVTEDDVVTTRATTIVR